MKSKPNLKVLWTWEEWQKSRIQRREISMQIGNPECRRSESSSDKRLRKAFNGKRAP